MRARLWRYADPSLSDKERQAHIDDLMEARRAVATAWRATDAKAETAARAAVEAAKRALGERGPVWWKDGAPDLTRHMVRTTSYAGWFSRQSAEASDR